MATKQLSTLNPRNFKEKIELLKKKEAASTANFAAAIRDACEIRQIAVAYDLSRLNSLSATSSPSLYGKASSVPDIRSLPSTNLPLEPAPTERTPLKIAENVDCISLDVQSERAPSLQSAVSHRLPLPSSALTSRLPTTTSEQLSTILSTTPPQFVSSDVQPRGGPNVCCYDVPERYSQGVGAVHSCHQLSSSGCFHPVTNIGRSHAMRHCSGPIPVLSDPAPTDYASFKSVRHWPATAPISSVSSNPSLATAQQNMNSLHLSPTQGADGKHLGSVVNRPCNTLDLSSTIASSLTPLAHFTPSPPKSSTAAGSRHFPPQGYGKHINNPHSFLSRIGSSVSQSSEFMAASQTAPIMMQRFPSTGIDSRRVSSDSSICNSLVTYQSAFRDFPCAYRHDGRPASSLRAASSHADPTPVGYSCFTFGNKKSESLRRHFPPDPIAGTPAYPASNSKFPNRSPDHFTSRCIEHRPSEEQHLLPPKRPFTSSIKHPLCVTGTGDHRYFGMHNLTLEDAKRNSDSHVDTCLATNYATMPCVLTTAQPNSDHSTSSHPSTIRQPSAVSSASAPNINISLTTASWSSAQAADRPNPPRANSPPPELYTCDPADLDRYLEIPGALLEPDDGGGKWTGRRDSCTMTAEVLSALSTVRSASPVFPSEKNLGVDSPILTISGPTKSTELPVYSNPLPSLAESHEEYGSSEPLIGEHLGLATPQVNLRRFSFQTVADQLGISITSKDYELLTDPQLANYVTDETTEAQLLR